MEGEGGGEEEASDLSKARCRQIVAAQPSTVCKQGQRPTSEGRRRRGRGLALVLDGAAVAGRGKDGSAGIVGG